MEHLRQAGRRTGTTVGATERLTTGGGSQLTLRTIGMRLYKKQDLNVSKYLIESSESVQPNQQGDRLQTVNQ